jgi:hypothetical protein
MSSYWPGCDINTQHRFHYDELWLGQGHIFAEDGDEFLRDAGVSLDDIVETVIRLQLLEFLFIRCH